MFVLKLVAIIILVLFAVTSRAQISQFRARVFIQDTVPIGGYMVIFPATKDTLYSSMTDSIERVDLTQPGHRMFYFTWGGWNSRIFRMDKDILPSGIQKINLPDTDYFKPFEKEHVCPICLSSRNIIPILYGLPLPRELKKSQRGKLRLGGCTAEVQYKYYCKKDGLEF